MTDVLGVAVCLDCKTSFPDPGTFPRCPTIQSERPDAQHRVVHVGFCAVCKARIGFVTDDDYCGPELLVCPPCLSSHSGKNK